MDKKVLILGSVDASLELNLFANKYLIKLSFYVFGINNRVPNQVDVQRIAMMLERKVQCDDFIFEAIANFNHIIFENETTVGNDVFLDILGVAFDIL
jgi:hypothetical protein